MTEKLKQALEFIAQTAFAAPAMTQAELGAAMARIARQCEFALAALASPDMEQRAGFVMVPPKDSEQLRLAVRAVKQTLFRGGSGVALPADSWIERAFIAGMLAATHPIEALEGGKTDSGASGPVHQDTSSTPASASEFRSLVAALRKFGEPGYAIGGELPLNSDQLIALDAANAIERLSSKSASERLRTLAKARAAHEASAAAHHSGNWHAAYEHHLNRHAAMQDLIDVLWPNAEAPDQDASSRSGGMSTTPSEATKEG